VNSADVREAVTQAHHEEWERVVASLTRRSATWTSPRRRNGAFEASWAKPGGMDDRAEIAGSQGVTYADLMRGSSLSTYAAYRAARAGSSFRWSSASRRQPSRRSRFCDGGLPR
jgi:hypothetical protein